MTCIDCKNSAERLWHGFQASCKGCQARAIARSPHFAEARRTGRQTARYQALLKAMLTNKTARKARQEVANAIRGGRLEPQPCFCCGKRAQAHHPDYSAPLAVVWLCTTHHAEVHKQTRHVLREQLCEA